MPDYKQAGVDIQKGEDFARFIQEKIQGTYGDRVVSGVGGFSGLYKGRSGKLLAAGADGVGTKVLLAQKLGIHHTVGIDLVAMCVNDILCVGATPLFFMDYLATGTLDLEVSKYLIEGVIEGCRQSECTLLGGETAEMPGMYPPGKYDLAGFVVGEVDEDKVLGGERVVPGQTLIGLSSSGMHSNGYSLIRKLIKPGEKDLAKELLAPTFIYWNIFKQLLQEECLSGAAHITGGGFLNIARMGEGPSGQNVNYSLDRVPSFGELPKAVSVVCRRSGLESSKLYKTFNMGIGMVLATSRPEKVEQILKQNRCPYWVMGKTTCGTGKVLLQGERLN